MENVTLAEAKENLEDLLERASKGQDVRIADPRLGTIRLVRTDGALARKPRRLGLLEGRLSRPLGPRRRVARC